MEMRVNSARKEAYFGQAPPLLGLVQLSGPFQKCQKHLISRPKRGGRKQIMGLERKAGDNGMEGKEGRKGEEGRSRTPGGLQWHLVGDQENVVSKTICQKAKDQSFWKRR